MSETVLVTGGAGYIGSHTAFALIEAGHSVVVVDNFVNAKADALHVVADLTGTEIAIVEGDARDVELLTTVIKDHGVTAVIHMAALKAVGESVEMPLDYYGNNLQTAIATLEAMANAGIYKFVFSSSATVYGDRIMPDPRRRRDRRDQPCLLYTSPSPRDRTRSRMPSSA